MPILVVNTTAHGMRRTIAHTRAAAAHARGSNDGAQRAERTGSSGGVLKVERTGSSGGAREAAAAHGAAWASYIF